ncbi:hypothetical protein DL96DRAFT_1627650 [Flagelloscypha sp. PMI_526]|nr:hypothetical protein DL96DRAFT_1627650 [Flagelloscypha sp. PMI_526]
MNLVDPSMSYLTRLIVPSKTSLRTLSCERLDYFIYCLEGAFSLIATGCYDHELLFNADAAYNPASQDFFNLNQYSTLTTFNAKLNLEHYEPLEMEQVLRPFSMILQSGKPTPTCAGLQTVSMQLEFSFAVGDTNDVPMWSPIVEALATISTLRKVALVIRLCPKDERKWSLYDVGLMTADRAEIFRYLPWKQCLEEALDEVGLLKITRVTYQLEGIDFQ